MLTSITPEDSAKNSSKLGVEAPTFPGVAMEVATKSAVILMVDDGVTNLELLKAILSSEGYDLRTFLSGAAALEAAESEPPDLILLDIAMPDLNGYQVCERLKASPMLAPIPVIFISALTETDDKVLAFASGGVDYITKPLQPAEVKARVKAQLQLFQHQQRLQEKLERIRHLEQLRDNLTHMVAHDMRSPISTISVAVELLKHQLANPEDNVRRTLEILDINAATLTGMVDQMLDISRMESGQMPLEQTAYDLAAQVHKVIASYQALENPGRVTLQPAEVQMVFADRDIIGRVIGNLVQNALKFSSPPQEINISITSSGEKIRFAIADQGLGIPWPDQDKIFEKFVQLESRKRRAGTGLGLVFCKLAVETHGGKIGVTSEPGKGSTFWFELPRKAITDHNKHP